jgi:multiphosphoryl transfer protein
MSNLVLIAPLEGWSTSLDEVPDAVFAERLLGDGVAIDPTSATLHAPCDGEVIALPAQKHAITLRAPNGAQILLHVGIDTVALNGVGFEPHVGVGARVKSGDALLTFDLDLLAQRAPSLITPMIVTDEVPFSVVRRVTDRAVAVGEFLMELAPASAALRHESSRHRSSAALAETAEVASAGNDSAHEHTARMFVPLEHGLHARPAALLAARAKHLAATITITGRGKSANARSATAIMALGVRKNDEITIVASGPDAAAATAALQDALTSAAKTERAAEVERAAEAGRTASSKSRTADLPAMEGAARRASVAPTRAPVAAANSTSPAAANTTPAVPRLPGEGAADPHAVRGVVAVPGMAVGTAAHLIRHEIEVHERGSDPSTENSLLDAALAAVSAEIRAAVTNEHAPANEVLAAHLEILDDPDLIARARSVIDQGKSAGFAWRQVMRANVELLRSLPDAHMAERAADLLDLEAQVLAALETKASNGTQASPAHRYPLPDRAIVLATELLPSQFIALDSTKLAGICTAGGGPTSHVAILAAASNVPMLVATGSALQGIPEGTPLILDADEGVLHVAPSHEQLETVGGVTAQRHARRAEELAAARQDCRTGDGKRIEVFANVGSVAEARAAVAQGAEGCGLLRTEFLFLDRETAPDEAAQTALYSGVIAAFEGRPVIVRTLDAGGDKPLAYMHLPAEENPALGVRGVRASLLYPHVLRAQIRAIVSAQPRGRCRILLPMISDPAEVRAIGEMLDEIRGELGHEQSVALGAMIETPAAAMMADQIAREADFLSIGTNDLTQYALAIDRGNPALASRLDSLHPAVLRLIARATEGARANCRDVAVCGGLASDLIAAPILIGLGVTELSAVPAVVPRVKALIRTLALADCETLAREALRQSTPADVRALVNRFSPRASSTRAYGANRSDAHHVAGPPRSNP